MLYYILDCPLRRPSTTGWGPSSTSSSTEGLCWGGLASRCFFARCLRRCKRVFLHSSGMRSSGNAVCRAVRSRAWTVKRDARGSPHRSQRAAVAPQPTGAHGVCAPPKVGRGGCYGSKPYLPSLSLSLSPSWLSLLNASSTHLISLPLPATIIIL